MDNQLNLFNIEGLERELVQIPLADLPHFVTTSDLDELVDSIKVYDQLYPILIAEYADGTQFVRDGGRRIEALRKLDKTLVWAEIIKNADNVSSEIWTLIANRRRSNNPIAELETLTKYIAGGKTMKEITKITGMTQQGVEHLLTLNNLQPEFIGGVKEGLIAPSVAFELAKLPATLQEPLKEPLSEGKKISATMVKDQRKVRTARMNAALLPSLPVIVPTPVVKQTFIVIADDDPRITNNIGDARKLASEYSLAEGKSYKAYRLIEQ